MRVSASARTLHLRTALMVMLIMLVANSACERKAPDPVAKDSTKNARRLLKKFMPNTPAIQAAAKPVEVKETRLRTVAKGAHHRSSSTPWGEALNRCARRAPTIMARVKKATAREKKAVTHCPVPALGMG